MNSGSQLVDEAAELLEALFAKTSLKWRSATLGSQDADLSFDLELDGKTWRLVCEVVSNGEPRHIRGAAMGAERWQRHRNSYDLPTYAVVVAPFISEASATICADLGVGYADLAGNCRLAFGTVYIEKTGSKNPFHVKREQRSLFAPKSARVLRALLTEPSREWKVAELAARTQVSYGQVSKIRQALLDREWAAGGWGGVRLANPGALLDAWRNAYAPLRMERRRYYSLLHGEALQSALRRVFETKAKLLLSSYSAARWLAPYARMAGEYFCADSEGKAHLKQALQLDRALNGANIIIDIASDDGVFQESLEPASGLRCTGLVQTYLDLYAAGERGAEAAEHLRETRIAPLWAKGATT